MIEKEYMEDEEEEKEEGEDTPLPTSKTQFGFSKSTAESGISKLFINALGKLSEKDPEEAYGVIEHLLSALGGASPGKEKLGPPPGPMGAMMGPPPPPNMPPPPPPNIGPPPKV